MNKEQEARLRAEIAKTVFGTIEEDGTFTPYEDQDKARDAMFHLAKVLAEKGGNK